MRAFGVCLVSRSRFTLCQFVRTHHQPCSANPRSAKPASQRAFHQTVSATRPNSGTSPRQVRLTTRAPRRPPASAREALRSCRKLSPPPRALPYTSTPTPTSPHLLLPRAAKSGDERAAMDPAHRGWPPAPGGGNAHASHAEQSLSQAPRPGAAYRYVLRSCRRSGATAPSASSWIAA